MYEAVTKSIAGNDLFYTGSQSFDLVHSQYASHRKTFETAEAAQKAVDPWNRLGHKFVVREVGA